ncbi:nitronate monooxygenase [Mycobacterium manitobense]|uniref:Nitronate monooxygenase n=1 Tax=[Mycobacterium] manitobense TaxID=190147 RepID=A0A9X2YCX3_9MYCO|nr:nitronate monooxygenase [[Mycobacterium] manitobense]MCV7172313.1 nitronate monooxygenase [[Mycobacterium] manitobense]
MSLTTPWSRATGLQVPVVNAPMGGAAGGALAAAVSRAGGLGMIGMGSSATPEELSAELRTMGDLGLPFGIGLVHWVMAAQPGLFEVALAARPDVLSVSFGDDWAWVSSAHAADVRVATQVGTVDAALRAVDAGVDVLVARGAEGGGHGEPRMGTLPLLTEVLDRVDVPVLAAGGIASARGLAAVLAAGASGAWLGTVFSTCAEALTPPQARAALLAAGGDATMITDEFDRAHGYSWPSEVPERVLRGADGRPVPVNAGQGVGMVTAAPGAATLIEQLCSGAEALLRTWVG